MSDIIKEAVKEAQSIKELAVEAAKNQIVESLAPAVRELVSRELRGKIKSEDVDRLRRVADGHGESEFEEGTSKGDLKMEKDKKDELDLESMFPGLSETDELPEAAHDEPDGDEPLPELEAAEIPSLGEAEELPPEGDMDEEIEISEAELRKVYAEALQAEVAVSKGFKDMTPSGELDDVDPAAGLADVKKGEAFWDDKAAHPPEKKDWTVKEIRQLVAAGIAENKKLRGDNHKLTEMVRTLGKRIAEVNLFNTKVVAVNKMLSGSRLTREQKRAVIEGIDRAHSVDEVKRIYEALESTLRSAGVVSESRKPKANAQGVRRSGGADQKVLRESADKSGGEQYSRWQQLAGLEKK